MPESTLTVHFRGICTHFCGVVPGVPLRTVLPDASPMRRGRVKVGDKEPEDYTIRPHHAAIATDDHIDIPEFIEKGVILKGVRMEIANADPSRGSLEFDDKFERILALTDYVEHYRPSTEVVHGGRAQCYFDFFSGRVMVERIGKEYHVAIRIVTGGNPILQVTPLVVEPPVPANQVWTFKLQSDKLTFLNVSANCRKERSYDFLLNYLTGQGGIPHAVRANFPIEEPIAGPTSPAGRQPFIFEEEFEPPSAAELMRCCLVNEGELPMCSDSRYP